MSTFAFGFVGIEDNEENHNSWYSAFQESVLTLENAGQVGFTEKNDQKVARPTTIDFDVAFNQIKLNDMVFRILKGKDIVSKSGTVDVIPGVYEGGLKLWECTFDLLLYLVNNHSISLHQDLRFLELGCGTGLVGIAAIKLFAPASIFFADFNEHVLSETTWPNIILNAAENNKCDIHCYSGDWIRLISLFKARHASFDVILAAEVLYTEENCKKIAFFLDQMLTVNGQAILANKRYYFGTGGGSTLFEQYINEIGTLSVTSISSIEDGQSNIRDIQLVTRKLLQL